MVDFTVFTPTFNRVHTIHRVYESLKNQSHKSFEWLVVDDGSTDGTQNLVQEYISQGVVNIRYLWQQNQGKHVAINCGVQLAYGRFFLIADSDDTFPVDALRDLLNAWRSIPEGQQKYFTGISGLCVDQNFQLIGDQFPFCPFDSNTTENLYRYNITGEKWGFHRTEILKKFPFPEEKDIAFFAEGIVWNRISQSFKTRYINKIVRVYYQDSPNALTNTSFLRRSSNRKIYAIYLSQDIKYFWIAPLKIIKYAVQGVRFSLHKKDTLLKQLSWIDSRYAKILWISAYPISLVFYLFDKAIFAVQNVKKT